MHQPETQTAHELTLAELEAGLEHICRAPQDNGLLELIVRRPGVGRREVVMEAQLDVDQGLVGDNWKIRGSTKTPDGSAHPEKQLNVMNSRVIALIAQTPNRWALAGDQLYLDLDLSDDNLPPGALLAIGSAVIEVTPLPHTGCQKFRARYGAQAVSFVNSLTGQRLHLRGINAKIVQSGVIRVGDVARKVHVAE